MRFVIQVCSNASVSVENEIIGKIDSGATVFIGVGNGDTTQIADKMIKKLLAMRIYPDRDGKTNLSIRDVGGSLLLISQFTLYADCRKGNRPSFINAAGGDEAQQLYNYIIDKCISEGINTQMGKFGADMKVNVTNEGPFTIVLDSNDICK